MKKIVAITFTLLLSAPVVAARADNKVAAPSAAPSPVTSPITGVHKTATVHGVVVSATGEAVQNAIVSVSIPGTTSTIASVRTNKNGEYTFAIPEEAQALAVRVICLGFSPVTTSIDGQAAPSNGIAPITLTPLAPFPDVSSK